jgi:hypothetical protein
MLPVDGFVQVEVGAGGLPAQTVGEEFGQVNDKKVKPFRAASRFARPQIPDVVVDA